MIKGIIFDFDGTIIDTETALFKAWDSVYQEYGQILPVELLRNTIGTADSNFHPAEFLARKIGNGVTSQELAKKEHDLELELINQNPPLPGVVDYLKHAREFGLKIGIASSATHDWVTGHLERLGLSNYFDAITTQEEVTLTKPFPYLFEKTLKKLGLYPYQVIAIEDSPFGITSAQAAGIFAVAIPNDATRPMKLDHADLVLESLADVSLSELINRITSV
jgi:HAD superfamily hydrolase (TIGR01509 family)